jgi:hypothetical protein
MAEPHEGGEAGRHPVAPLQRFHQGERVAMHKHMAWLDAEAAEAPSRLNARVSALVPERCMPRTRMACRVPQSRAWLSPDVIASWQAR